MAFPRHSLLRKELLFLASLFIPALAISNIYYIDFKFFAPEILVK